MHVYQLFTFMQYITHTVYYNVLVVNDIFLDISPAQYILTSDVGKDSIVFRSIKQHFYHNAMAEISDIWDRVRTTMIIYNINTNLVK